MCTCQEMLYIHIHVCICTYYVCIYHNTIASLYTSRHNTAYTYNDVCMADTQADYEGKLTFCQFAT